MAAPIAGLAGILGAALAPLAQDGTWHATTLDDTGAGGVAATVTDTPIKLVVESLSAQDRIGLPRTAVRLLVLRAGLPGAIGLDDAVTVGGMTYRIVEADTDPAGAAWALAGVPA